LVAALRAITVLAVCAASLVLFGWQIASDLAVDFLRANLLEPALRVRLIASMLAAAGVTAVGAAVYVRHGSFHAIARLRRTALLVSPLTLAGVVPAILAKDATQEPLTVVLGYAAFTLLFERLLRVSLQAVDDASGGAATYRPSRRSRVGLFIAVAAALFYAGYMSTYTIFAHMRFRTYNFDLGQYDNVFWNAMHGRPLVCTPLGLFSNWSSFSSHADLGVFVLLPIYALYPHAETLLALQSTILGLGAIPLYLFAVRRLPTWSACTLAICYLLFPPMHGSNFYDFHFQPVAGTFVLLTIWAVDARRWVWLTISFLIALSCREDISVGLTVLGLYLVLARHRTKAGFLMAVAGATYFVVIRFVIMPRFGTGWFSDIYKDLYPQPKGPFSYGGVMQTLITNPGYVFRTLLTADKLKYFCQIMVPVAFLPLRRAYLLPLLAPGALFTLLTTGYGPTIDIAFQYSGHFTPYIFTASAVALASYRGVRPAALRAGVAALVVGTFLCTRMWGAFPPRGSVRGGFAHVTFDRPTRADLQKARDLAELAAMIPRDVSFAVTDEELPHVSGHPKVLALREGPAPADYVLFSPSSGGGQHGTNLVASGEYVEVASRPGLQLIRKK
jgi:uncharacterized membrane protein